MVTSKFHQVRAMQSRNSRKLLAQTMSHLHFHPTQIDPAKGGSIACQAKALTELGITQLDWANNTFMQNGQTKYLGSPTLDADNTGFRQTTYTKGVKLETVDENGNYGIRMIVTRVSDLAAGDNHVLNYEDADGSARNPLASAGITSWPLKAKTGRLAGFNKKGESCISKV